MYANSIFLPHLPQVFQKTERLSSFEGKFYLVIYPCFSLGLCVCVCVYVYVCVCVPQVTFFKVCLTLFSDLFLNQFTSCHRQILPRVRSWTDRFLQRLSSSLTLYSFFIKKLYIDIVQSCTQSKSNKVKQGRCRHSDWWRGEAFPGLLH